MEILKEDLVEYAKNGMTMRDISNTLGVDYRDMAFVKDLFSYPGLQRKSTKALEFFPK